MSANKKYEEQIIPMSEHEWHMFLFGDLILLEILRFTS